MVGRQIHFAEASATSDPADDALVAVGMGLDETVVGAALATALEPARQDPSPRNLTRLERRLILSGDAGDETKDNEFA